MEACTKKQEVHNSDVVRRFLCKSFLLGRVNDVVVMLSETMSKWRMDGGPCRESVLELHECSPLLSGGVAEGTLSCDVGPGGFNR